MNRKLETLSLFVAVTLFVLFAFPHPALAQTPLFGPQTEYTAAKHRPPRWGGCDFSVLEQRMPSQLEGLVMSDQVLQDAARVIVRPERPWDVGDQEGQVSLTTQRLESSAQNFNGAAVGTLLAELGAPILSG